MTKKNELVKRIMEAVAVFNHYNNVNTEVAVMIAANTNNLDKAVEAKLTLVRLINEAKKYDLIVNVYSNIDAYITSVDIK